MTDVKSFRDRAFDGIRAAILYPTRTALAVTLRRVALPFAVTGRVVVLGDPLPRRAEDEATQPDLEQDGRHHPQYADAEKLDCRPSGDPADAEVGHPEEQERPDQDSNLPGREVADDWHEQDAPQDAVDRLGAMTTSQTRTARRRIIGTPVTSGRRQTGPPTASSGRRGPPA